MQRKQNTRTDMDVKTAGHKHGLRNGMSLQQKQHQIPQRNNKRDLKYEYFWTTAQFFQVKISLKHLIETYMHMAHLKLTQLIVLMKLLD